MRRPLIATATIATALTAAATAAPDALTWLAYNLYGLTLRS